MWVCLYIHTHTHAHSHVHPHAQANTRTLSAHAHSHAMHTRTHTHTHAQTYTHTQKYTNTLINKLTHKHNTRIYTNILEYTGIIFDTAAGLARLYLRSYHGKCVFVH